MTVHPEHCDVWFWTIPFADGRCSLGVVAETELPGALRGYRHRAPARHRRRGAVAARPAGQRRVGHAGAPDHRLCGQRRKAVGQGLRTARQRRRIPRPGIFVRRDDRLQVGQPGGGGAASASSPARRSTGRPTTAYRCAKASTPSARSSTRGTRRLPEDHFPRGQTAGSAAHDRRHPGRLCLGRDQPVRQGDHAPPGRAGGTMCR